MVPGNCPGMALLADHDYEYAYGTNASNLWGCPVVIDAVCCESLTRTVCG